MSSLCKRAQTLSGELTSSLIRHNSHGSRHQRISTSSTICWKTDRRLWVASSSSKHHSSRSKRPTRNHSKHLPISKLRGSLNHSSKALHQAGDRIVAIISMLNVRMTMRM